jgi:hypothetical protein
MNDVTYADNRIILTSNAGIPGPRFSLTYEKTGEERINICFEMATPDAPEEIKVYLKGKNRKINWSIHQ